MFILTGGEFNLGLIISKFDFLAFKVNLLANIHSLTLLSSIVNLLPKWSIEEELTSNQVASANKRSTLLTLLGRSLLYRVGQKKLHPWTQCHNFFLHEENNLKFLPFFYNEILRSCLKFYIEIPRSYKMTFI